MPDNTTYRQEKDRIALGSVDVYVTEWTGTAISDIPEDATLEVDANLIGRTKDGAEFEYQTNYYSVKRDDGKASRNEMTDDNGYMSYGMITWNGDTISKLIETASATVSGTGTTAKRRTLIGGVANANGKTYLFRAVHKDKVKGDVLFAATILPSVYNKLSSYRSLFLYSIRKRILAYIQRSQYTCKV